MADFADFNIDLNLDEVQAWDGNYSMIAEGSYVFEISHAEQKTTSGGNPGLKFTFTVVDDSPENGKTLTKTYSLKANVLGRLKAVLQAAGYTQASIVGSELLGRRFVADVKHGMMPDRPLPDGTVQPGKPSMDIRGERPVESAPAEVPAPVVAQQKKAVAATAATKNGASAARR